MSERIVRMSQDEAHRKYNNATHIGNDMVEVRVRYKADGSEDPSCWNAHYRAQMEKKNQPEKKSSKSSSKSSGKKGFMGLSPWNPLCWILWIICLPFRIVWWILKNILKIFGIMAIINFFTGGGKD